MSHSFDYVFFILVGMVIGWFAHRYWIVAEPTARTAEPPPLPASFVESFRRDDPPTMAACQPGTETITRTVFDGFGRHPVVTAAEPSFTFTKATTRTPLKPKRKHLKHPVPKRNSR